MEKRIIVAAGGLVTNEDGALLFIFRRGKWDLPKGKLDPGETIEACAVREVQEETGVQELVLGEFIGITKHAYYDKYVRADVVKESHWYAMHSIGNPTLVPQTEEDITDIKWVNNSDISACLQNSYETIVTIIELARAKELL